MVKAIDNHRGASTAGHSHNHERDWSKAMSDNVALALIVYTGLQIFVTVNALKEGVSSTLPYFALIILVAAIIPACRWAEKRWRDTPPEAARDDSLKSEFRRDQFILWTAAIGLPLLLTAVFKAVFSGAA